MPSITMQFTDKVKGSPFDFVVVGILLLGTGLMCELVIRKVKKVGYWIVLGAALLATPSHLLELSAGIFRTQFART